MIAIGGEIEELSQTHGRQNYKFTTSQTNQWYVWSCSLTKQPEHRNTPG